MEPDGDPDPFGVPPPTAFYGLWPRFGEPVSDETDQALARSEPPARHASRWPSAFAAEARRSA